MMKKWIFAILAMLMVVTSGCATHCANGGSAGGGASASTGDGGLPAIAPYNEPTYEPLPAFVPAAA